MLIKTSRTEKPFGMFFLFVYDVANAVKNVFGTVWELIYILERSAATENKNRINV